MVFTRLAGTALALMVGGLTLGGASDAHAFRAGTAIFSTVDRAAGSSRTGMLRVASSSVPAQVSSAEAQDAVTGIWHGNWTNDISGGAGKITIDVKSAVGGDLSGSGNVEGGDCAKDFSVAGWYRGSLAELKLTFPAAGAQCPAATVTISMRMGRKGGQTIGLGHWADMVDGRSAGKGFGVLELSKQ